MSATKSFCDGQPCWANASTPGLLAILGDLTEQATLEVLGRLREAGLVADARELDDGRLAFRHALTREAVLGELLGPERRRRHARPSGRGFRWSTGNGATMRAQQTDYRTTSAATSAQGRVGGLPSRPFRQCRRQ